MLITDKLTRMWKETVTVYMKVAHWKDRVADNYVKALLYVLKDTEENRITRRKTCLSAILSTTNSTWTALGWNPSSHMQNLAINSLSSCLTGTVLSSGEKVSNRPTHTCLSTF